MTPNNQATPTPSTSGQSPTSSQNPTCSAEEYRLYYETTDKVIDRRHALNNWNYSICLAMLGANAIIVNTMLSRPELRLALLSTIMLLAVLGGILCWFWIAQLRDLKRLNRTKFAVLNNMAPLVRFPEGHTSFEPFKKEWEQLEHEGALVSGSIIGTKVLNASRAEFVLPSAFGVIFSLTAVASGLLAWQNWDTLVTKPLTLPATENVTDFNYQPGTADR